MGKIIAFVLRAFCGIGQFFIMRHTLKPLSEEGNPMLIRGILLKVPIPFALLLGCAYIDVQLLPFAGSAFCISLVVSGVINHLVTLKKEG